MKAKVRLLFIFICSILCSCLLFACEKQGGKDTSSSSVEQSEVNSSFSSGEQSDTDQQVRKFTVTVDGGEGGGNYEEGSVVTVVAYQKEGKVFSDWRISGKTVSYESTYTFTVTADVTVIAVFVQKPAAEKIAVSIVNGSGSGKYEKSAQVTAKSSIPDGKVFVGWSDGGIIVSENDPYVFNATEDITLVAVFADFVDRTDAMTIGEGFIYEQADFRIRNFTNSGRAIVFDYKPLDRSDGKVSFTLWSENWGKRVSGIITIDIVKDAVEGGIGEITKAGDGWRRVTINCEDIPINTEEGATGKETVVLMYFNTVGNSFLIDEIGVLRTTPVGNMYSVIVDGGTGGGTYEEGEEATVVADETSIRSFICWQVGGVTVSAEPTYTFTVSGDVEVKAIYEYAPSSLTYYAPDNALQIEKSASPDYSEDTLAFAAAKGEKESGQVILYNGADLPETHYYVEFGDLTHVETGAVIDASNISSYVQHYVCVTENWDSGSYNSSYYPDGKTDLGVGYYPDALIPYDVAVFSGENKICDVGGKDNGLWFTLSVPKNARCGVYSGALTIVAENDGYLFIPVSVTVYDFTMPSQTYYKSNVGLWGQFGEVIGVEGYEAGGYFGMETDYYQKMRAFITERKLSVEGIQTHYFVAQMDMYVDKAREVTENGNIGAYNLLPMVKHNVSITLDGITYNDLNVVMEYDEYFNDVNRIMGLRTLLKGLAEASTNEVDLLKKAIIRVPENDEPGATIESYIQCVLSENVIRRSINYVLNDANVNWTGKENVKNSLKGLTVINTVNPGKTPLFKGESTTFYYKVDGGVHKITKKGSGISEFFNPTPSATIAIPADHTLYYDETAGDPSTRVYIDYNKMYGACSEFNCYRYGTEYYPTLNSMLNDSDPETHVWWYSCCNPEPPYASLLINAPMIKLRANRFIQFSLGIEGELYYCANRWTQEYKDADGNACVRSVDPWVDPNRINGCNGDGMLIYPALNRYAEYNATRSEDEKILFCSSLRLENYMESADDYDYLRLAQSLIDDMPDGSAKTNAQTALNGYVSTLFGLSDGAPDPYRCTDDPSVLKTARSNVAALIVSLQAG